MPLRYAQETQFLAQISIVADVCRDCERAMVALGPANWPIFGGWENLMPSRAMPEHVTPDLLVSPEAGDSGMQALFLESHATAEKYDQPFPDAWV